MKTFAELMETSKTKLPELPAIKTPAKAAVKGREEIPGLGAKVEETDKVETIAEGSSFRSSIEATEHFSSIVDAIVELRLLANDSKLAAWCKVTDSNFGTASVKYYTQLVKQLYELRKTAQRIDDEFDAAE